MSDGMPCTLSRRRALWVIGSAPFFSSCARTAPIRVASKNFVESVIIAEAYAASLESASFVVQRKMFLGIAQELADGTKNGDIDVYPEYTSSGLMEVLHLRKPIYDTDDVMRRLRSGYASYRATWLNPSAAHNSQALAVPECVTSIHKLSQCAYLAPKLRLAAPGEFLGNVRSDGLVGLRSRYGGFHFRNVISVKEMGQQYDELLNGHADVIAVSETDPQIKSNGLRLLKDDLHFWPSYQIAPVVSDTVKGDPKAVHALNKITAGLNQMTLQRLDDEVYDDGRDPADVAQALVSSINYIGRT
jgi:osmoprotectant transport system substrate-binding protein